MSICNTANILNAFDISLLVPTLYLIGSLHSSRKTCSFLLAQCLVFRSFCLNSRSANYPVMPRRTSTGDWLRLHIVGDMRPKQQMHLKQHDTVSPQFLPVSRSGKATGNTIDDSHYSSAHYRLLPFIISLPTQLMNTRSMNSYCPRLTSTRTGISHW